MDKVRVLLAEQLWGQEGFLTTWHWQALGLGEGGTELCVVRLAPISTRHDVVPLCVELTSVLRPVNCAKVNIRAASTRLV